MEQEVTKSYSNTDLGIKERGKCKYPADYTSKDYYKFYKENLNNKELPLGTEMSKMSYTINSTTYMKILLSIFRKAREKMILNNMDYILPCQMGSLAVCKIERKLKIDEEGNVISKVPIDYKATRELWATDEESKRLKKKVYLFNENFKGFMLKIVWIKHKSNLFKKGTYKFTAVREFKRQVPALVKKHPELDFYLTPYSNLKP